MCCTTVLLLVLHLLTAPSEGAAVDGGTGNSSDPAHSFIVRIPKEGRKHPEPELSTTQNIKDDLVRFPVEEWMPDLSSRNLTGIKIDTMPKDNNSQSNSFKWRILIIRLVKLGWMLAALALTGWGINRMCCAKSTQAAAVPVYLSEQPPYPNQQPPYPNQQTPYPNQQTPYPNQQPPYLNQQTPYPNQQPPNPSQQTPYPNQQPPYPLQPMPYPGQAPYNSSGVMPYPVQQPPYPPQSAQQTLSPSGVESLCPPNEATNPYFKMPPPDGGLAVSGPQLSPDYSSESKSDHV